MNIPKVINEIGTLEDYGCEINNIGIDELFQKYEDFGFIYPAKKKRLEKVMPEIIKNWKKVLKIDDSPIQVITHRDSKNSFGTMVILQNINHGTLNHHGIGNKLHSSALAFLTAQAIQFERKEFQSAQIWFREKNRIMNHICGSGINNVSNEFSFNRTFNYIELKPRIDVSTNNQLQFEPFHKDHKAVFEQFILRERGVAFLTGEELNSDDILLGNLNQVYQEVGLEHYRQIWLVFKKSNLIGVAIAYKSPVGLNFSFLNNRCELIISPNLAPDLLKDIVAQLLSKVAFQYLDFSPGFIPVIADDKTAKQVEELGGQIIRRYTQHLWTRKGYEDWYFGAISAVKNILLREYNKNTSQSEIEKQIS